MRRTLAAMPVAAVLLASVVSCGPGTGGSLPGKDILDLINEKRVAAGAPPVTGDDQLGASAVRQATDMRDNNSHKQPGKTPHTGSDGSSIEKRITDAGFTPLSSFGEIQYAPGSASSAQQTVDAWMNSPIHKGIMLDPQYTHAGVGLLYPGGTKWYAVVDFAKH